MSIVAKIFGGLFGGGAQGVANAATTVAGAFRVNAEAADKRAHTEFMGVHQQYAMEFLHPPQGWFANVVDGLNRLVRPSMAFSVIGLFAYCMADPIGFTGRMLALESVPDFLWYGGGMVLAFYFQGRMQYKKHAEQRVHKAADLAGIVAKMDDLQKLRKKRGRAISLDSTNPVYG